MNIREGKGFVTESDLATISHLRVNDMLNRVNTLIDGEHVASQSTPSRVHVQSAFKPEAWHQGESPGPWVGPSQMDSAFLECSPYPGDAGARPKTPENSDVGYREQIKKNEWSHPSMGDPNQGNPQHEWSSIKTKLHWPGEASAWGQECSNQKGRTFIPHGSHKQLCVVRGQHPVFNQVTLVGDSMRHPTVDMASARQ
ncbi:unnamed protein product [Mytilus edulis]|uniref:Uncharacterized protein n=1 Tax=Mytilus edulis TaxID=6550 RepID=A0A8S3Q3G2_MYTED|nr:unnamed protein product [Mytilus edulis]